MSRDSKLNGEAQSVRDRVAVNGKDQARDDKA
jgi:hypothetical protein